MRCSSRLGVRPWSSPTTASRSTAIQNFGRLDVVVNNAGIADPGLFGDLSMAQFRRMIDVHYFGTLNVCRAAWPYFVAAGAGRIVNTASEAMLGGLSQVSS